MLSSLRAITALMLVAGASLGLFAGTLLAGDPEQPRPVLIERIEANVQYYRELYDLDEEAQDQLRVILRDFRRQLHEKYRELQERHVDEFDAIKLRTEKQIREVVGR